MKVGLNIPALQSIDVNESIMKLAESMSLDSLWMSDHFLGIAHPAIWPEYAASEMFPDPDAFLDPFCLAAVLGRQTDLILGTCVTDGTRRRGADLARSTLTLNNGCRGGFILGIGAGEAESLVPFGYDFSRPVGTLEETLKELRAMIDLGRMPGSGVGRTGLPLVGPTGKPKIWIAASGDRSLKLAGRFADGWVPMPESPKEYARKFAIVNATAKAAGRPPLVGSMLPLLLLGDSRAHAAAALEANPLGRLITLFSPASVWHRYGLQHPTGPTCRGTLDVIPHALDPEELQKVAEKIPMEMVEESVFCGNADELAERLGEYAEIGLEHVVLGDYSGLVYSSADYGRLMETQLPDLVQKLKSIPARRVHATVD